MPVAPPVLGGLDTPRLEEPVIRPVDVLQEERRAPVNRDFR
jgi:hypothetical protein